MSKDFMIQKLEIENKKLQEEIKYFKSLLDNAGISYLKEQNEYSVTVSNMQKIDEVSKNTEVRKCSEKEKQKIIDYRIELFMKLFCGREDVFARRFVSKKTGVSGYAPACANFWNYNLCPKANRQKIKCFECKNHRWLPITKEVIYKHLVGEKEDCTDVVGVYPMLQDEGCRFLVFDFDYHDKEQKEDVKSIENLLVDQWQREVDLLRKICAANDVDVLVERSRSGNGAHLWIFFEEAISAELARRFGSALLTKGAELVNQTGFATYDRMLPAQDKMPKGGFGNLVALPLQGQARKRGNSDFVDENWNVIKYTWNLLENIKPLGKDFIEDKISRWTPNGVLGSLASDMSGSSKEKPWEKKQPELLKQEDFENELKLIVSNQIYIEKESVKPRALNRIRRLAAFSNPQFYKLQAMRLSTRNIPRIISCSTDIDEYVCLPRGCKERLEELLKISDVKYSYIDKRQVGKKIDISFNGVLYPEQQNAAKDMLQFENGILGAATGFGKTVLGAYLISERKVNTLILVHNREIMKRWQEDLEKFLEINEELPAFEANKGRRKRKNIIGKLYAAHNSMNGIVDIAMISSMGKEDNVNQCIKDYGMVIMDECHHAGAYTFENVLKEVNAKYVYGLTATPNREDGHEQIVYMQFGPIRYRLTAKARADTQSFSQWVFPRFTRLIKTTEEKWTINDVYKTIITDEARNNLIVSDTLGCVKNSKTPLILTKYREHADKLMMLLDGKVDNLILLMGGLKCKEKDEITERLKNIPSNESLVIVAIGKYVGEGFNFPRLDTLILAMPISWKGNVEQYAGRLHRDYDGKEEVIIYDYVDVHIKMLERMYQKRLATYAKMGYEICTTVGNKKELEKLNTIYSHKTYKEQYERDVINATKEIVISSPGMNKQQVVKILKLLDKPQLAGVEVIVITLHSEEYPGKQKIVTEQLVESLKSSGVSVKTLKEMHEHFAVIDREIVWYGSMSLLSREREDDNLMRLHSKEIAEELLEIYF